MSFSVKHAGLLIGFSLITISFLFFATQPHLYEFLQITGLMLSSIFCLLVLHKERLKSKILWNLIIMVYLIIQPIAEPFLIDASYRRYIIKNRSLLNEVNIILENKKGNIKSLSDTINNKNNLLTISEQNKLLDVRKKLGIYFISKSGNRVYYAFGNLDSRSGITYCPEKTLPANDYRHLMDDWFL